MFVALLVLLPLLAEEERRTPGWTATSTGAFSTRAGGRSARRPATPTLWGLRGGD